MNGDRLILRGVAAADHAAWRLLWSNYLTFYDTVLPRSVTMATWERLLDPAAPMQGIVATKAAKVVGFAHVVLQPTTWSEHPNAYLQDLFVSPRYRRIGAARTLIDAATICAASAGATRLVWLTRADNHTARSLHDQVGAATGFVQYQKPTPI